jgi:hypothetical protein
MFVFILFENEKISVSKPFNSCRQLDILMVAVADPPCLLVNANSST